MNQLDDIKTEIFYTLNHIFNSSDIPDYRFVHVSNHPSTSLVDGTLAQGGHIYQRNKLAWLNPRLIEYDGSPLAVAQAKPHKQMFIFNVHARERMARNILIKTLHDSFPKVKVLYE